MGRIIKSPSIGRLSTNFSYYIMKKFNILSFGEIIHDVYQDKTSLGGAPLNFAAFIKQGGARSFLLSAVGKDRLGDDALNAIKKAGICCDYITVNDKPTGSCSVTLNKGGVPNYDILKDVAYDNILASEQVFLQKFDVLYFGTLALRSQNNLNTVKRLLESANFDMVFCDLNLRKPFFDNKTVGFCLKNTQILKVSEDELSYIEQEFLDGKFDSHKTAATEIFDKYNNLEQIILTCGSDGAYVYINTEDKEYYCPAKKVKVVSTVGAGDSFAATYLIEYLKGNSIDECLKKATDASASVVSRLEGLW